jgi:hypothetical protein
VHCNIDFTSAQSIAYRADKHARTADLGQVALVDITGGSDPYEVRIDAAGCQRRGYLVRLCLCECGPT